MKKNLDLESLLTPIPGENPAGEALRYDPVYDEIQEARRADDLLDRGEWQQELKSSDWQKVHKLCVSVLTERTKDLQIGVWLLESLASMDGFSGLHDGLQVLNGFLQKFWDDVYPIVEDNDLDYRVGPLEFLNDKLWLVIKQIPLTDSGVTPGYSWLQWQESRKDGSGKDKITAEEFNRAVAGSSKSFYVALYKDISDCRDQFKILDELVDEKFGREAPRLAEFKAALEDCEFQVGKILKDKRVLEPDAVTNETEFEEQVNELESQEKIVPQIASPVVSATQEICGPLPAEGQLEVSPYRVNRLLGSAGIKEAVWRDALTKLESAGIKPALEQLLGASCSAQSMREKTNFRLLMAMLCLKGNRSDLARPIVEELNTQMEDLQLSKWESPIWIAEVLDVLYQCLTAGGASDDDIYRAKDIWKRICTLDVTKAMGHKS